MELRFGEINWLAVIVTGLVVFFLGGLWYTALFGRLWQRLQGYSPERIEAMRRKTPPPVFFSCMIASYLVVAAVVAILVTSFNIRGAAGGVLLGALLWLGPTAALGMTGQVASDRHIGAFWIDSGFHLLALTLSGAVLAAWR